MLINENAWLYFFSANAQVFAAIIAILGVFVVYALQGIQNSIEWSRSDLVQLWKPLSVNLESLTLDKQLEASQHALEDRRSKSIEPTRINEVERVMNVIKERRQDRVEVKAEFKKIVVIDMVLLAVSLALLPWAKKFCEWPNLSAAALLVVLGSSIYAVFRMARFIGSVV